MGLETTPPHCLYTSDWTAKESLHDVEARKGSRRPKVYHDPVSSTTDQVYTATSGDYGECNEFVAPGIVVGTAILFWRDRIFNSTH